MKLIFNLLGAVMAFLFAGLVHTYAAAAQAMGATNPLFLMGANTIDSDLQLDLVLDAAMEAFKEMLTPLAMFSTVFRDIPLQGTDKVVVPYYALETAASKDFNGTYLFDGTATSSRELTIDKRKYQSLAFTSAELARQPHFDPERLGRLKGQKLAEDVLVDIWSIITAANYGAAIFTGAAADFDVDDVIDIETTLTETYKWPMMGRGMILKPSYIGGLKKDMNANGGFATFNRDSNGNLLTFPSLQGFSFAPANVIPANGENLRGFAVFPSAMLVGFSPIQPAPAVMDRLNDYRIVSDDDVGISLEYREWGDADTDTEKRTIEVNYGRAFGEQAALKRIVSA